MQGLIAALPNDLELARELGKKGTANGITFFNRKLEGKYVTVLAPSDIAEKYYALPQSIMLANVVVLSTAKIDVVFGESLVAASLLNKPVILTDDSDASKFLASLNIDSKVISRDELLVALLQYMPEPSGEARIDIDKAFPVKGVGDVLLGIVSGGEVKVHDVFVHPSGKEVTIRSIQAQDEDIPSAGKGVRVGLAIKGMGYEEFEKGDVLAASRIKKSSTLKFAIELAPYAGIAEEQLNGMQALLAYNFSTATATIEKNGNAYSARQIAIAKGDAFLLVKDSSPRIFAKGIVQDTG